MIFYDESWMSVPWDGSCQAVWNEWKAYAEGDQYREALEAVIVCLRKNNASRLLSDARKIGPIRQEDQRWTREDWRVRAIGAGLRWIAVVTPKSSVARLSVRGIGNKITDNDAFSSHFDNLELARAWIRNPTKP